MAEERRNITIILNGKEVQNTIASINSEYRKQLREIKGVQRGTTEYKNKMAELRQTKAILDKHRSDIRGVGNEWDGAQRKQGMFSRMASGGLKSLATSFVAPLAAGTALVSMFQRGIGTIREFNVQMDKLQAISGANSEQMAVLESTAKQMGASTIFSASESAEAMTFMAMAGWDTQQIVSGLPGVLDLAAASGESLAKTSDIVTDALTAFGMQASDSTQFADLLASASSAANTNVSMMGDTFRYVAPVFGAFGFSAEDAALATGLMANSGIKATQAGTALRGALSRMAKPTSEVASTMESLGLNITDADGNFLPFIDTMGQLREKFAELTPAQQAQSASALFGQEAMSGMLAIINASEEEFTKLTDATRNYDGAAKEMADVMNDNLTGAMRRFNSVVESLILQFSDADGVLKHFVNFGADYLSEFGKEISGLRTQFSQLWSSIDDLVNQFMSATGISMDFAEGFNFIGLMVKFSTTPIRTLVAVVFSLVEGFKFVTSQVAFYARSIVNEVRGLANDAIETLNRIPGVEIETRFEIKEDIPKPQSWQETWDKVSGQFSDIFSLEVPVEPVVDAPESNGSPGGGGGGGGGGDAASRVLQQTMERLGGVKAAEIDTAAEIEAAKEAIFNEGLLRRQAKLDEQNAQELADAQVLAEQKAEFEQQMTELAFNTASQLMQGQLAERARSEQTALEEQRELGLISEEAYEEERDAIQRRAFERQKLADTAQAIINGALAVTKVTAQTGVLSPFAIPGIVASTAAQVALIQSQKYEKGDLFLEGPSHRQGGMPVIDPRTGRKRAELEGGEFIIRKRAVTPSTLPLLRAINDGSTPRVNFGRYQKWKYEEGGVFDLATGGRLDTESRDATNQVVVEKLDEMIGEMTRWQREFTVVLRNSELENFQDRLADVERVASIRA